MRHELLGSAKHAKPPDQTAAHEHTNLVYERFFDLVAVQTCISTFTAKIGQDGCASHKISYGHNLENLKIRKLKSRSLWEQNHHRDLDFTHPVPNSMKRL